MMIYNVIMCGRYSFDYENEKDFLNRFEIDSINFELRESYNVAPTQQMPIVERHSPNSLHLRKWGVVMPWGQMINAKAEGVAESRVWKKAFTTSRCIVPASAFYEWKRLDDGKQPYLIKLKHEKMFGMAGLIVTYHDEKGIEKEGYVIITTTPNKLMSDIHNRMPVILRKEDEEEWLNPDVVEPEKLLKLLNPYPTEDMEAYPISSLVNSPSNNYKEITNPLK